MNIALLNSLVGGGGINAKIYGFLPSADATTNTAALQMALDSNNKIIYIDSGTYNLNSTIFIPSNKLLKFSSNVTFLKNGNYGQILMNKGVLTNSVNENIEIQGNGLLIKNTLDAGNSTIPYAIAQIAWIGVNNLKISGVNGEDVSASQYWMSFVSVHLASIFLCSISGNKDGFDLIGDCSDITFDYITTTTRDDPFYIGTAGYPISTMKVGNITNINVKNWTNNNNPYYGVRVACYAWDNYTNGNVYQAGDFCTNAGNIYISEIVSGTVTASVPPTHTTGKVTGVDGIPWRFIQAGTITGTSITGLTFENVTNSCKSDFIHINNETNSSTRVIYPSSISRSIIDNVILNNVSMTATGGVSLVSNSSNVVKLTIENTTLSLTGASSLFTNSYVASQVSAVGELIIKNSNINIAGTTGKLVNNIGGAVKKVSIISSTIESSVSKLNNTSIALQSSSENITITDSTLKNLPDLIYPANQTGMNLAIVCDNAIFDGCLSVVNISPGSETMAISFNGNACSFTNLAGVLFRAPSSAKPLTVTTTNSITKPVNADYLFSGNYITLSSCDLQEGAELIKNGTFTVNTNDWTATRATLSVVDTACRLTSNGTAGGNSMTQSIYNSLGTNLEVRFKAKSPTSTQQPTVMAAPAYSSYAKITCPNLTTTWQDYVFRGTKPSTIGAFLVVLNTSLPNGEYMDVDDISVKTY